MSWVRQAIDGIKAHPYEELYPTAYGSSAEKPGIFWALNPNDVPPPVKEAIEAAVRQQAVESNLTCAIIRLETLGGYYAQENKSTNSSTTTDDPVGHFAIYLGTSPADTELKIHLPTNLAADPPTTTTTTSNPPKRLPAHAEADAEAEQQDTTHTPSMSEIEEDYSRAVEEERSSSKRASKRLSKITASVGNFIRLN